MMPYAMTSFKPSGICVNLPLLVNLEPPLKPPREGLEPPREGFPQMFYMIE